MSIDPTPTFQEAVRRHQAGDLEEAEACYERILAERPQAADAHHLLGLIAEQKGDRRRAVARISRAIELDDGVALYHYNLGNLDAAARNDEGAIACYRNAVERDPKMWEAHHNLGRTFDRAGNLAAARKALETAVALQPESVEALILLASVLIRLGDIAGAIERMKAAWARAPEQVHLLKVLAFQLLRSRRLDEAKAAYQELARLSPDNAEAHVGLSCLLAEEGRIDEAERATATATRLDPIVRMDPRGSETGSVLILYSTENNHYRMMVDGPTAPISNNVETHLDRKCWLVHRAYVHETFLEDVVPRLPPYDIVLNLITDPDICPRSLDSAQRFADRLSVPVLNPPAAVLQATRDGNYRRFHDLPGICWPKTVRCRFGEDPTSELAALVEREGFDYPVIARRAGTHTGRTVVKADDLAGFAGYADRFAHTTAFVTQFVENSVDGAHYRRLRFFSIDGRLLPRNIQYTNHWNTHEGVSMDVMYANAGMQEEDRRFLEDPEGYLGGTAYAALQGLAERVGLDYFGLDFDTLATGELLLFELNPSMNFTERRSTQLPYRLPSFQTLREAIDRMLRRRLSA